MKKISSLFAIIALLAFMPAKAQTNGPSTFFQTAESYVTSFNISLTNTFGPAKRIEVWAGVEQNQGNNTAADFGVEADLWTLSQSASSTMLLGGESVTKNAGIAGTILAQQGGVNLKYIHWDTQFEGYIDGGYDFFNKRPYGEPGLRIKKALTDNTFAGVSISIPIERGWKGTPNLLFLTGFTF